MKKLLTLLLFLVFTAFAPLHVKAQANKQVREIAVLSSSFLYNLDNENLSDIIKSKVSKIKNIKAIKIIDSIDKEIFISIYRDDDKLISDKEFPSHIKAFEVFESSISYDDEVIGKVLLYYHDEKKILLSPEEKKWLKNNPIIKIAIMSYWKSDINQDNIHTNIIKLLNKYSDLNIISVKFDSWEDGFSEAIEGKNIHAITNLSWSKEREATKFHYTKAYSYTPSYLIVKKDDTSIKSLTDLANKTIYLETGSITHKLVEKIENIQVIDLANYVQIYKKLSTSKDIVGFISYKNKPKELKKYNLKIVKTMYDKYGEVSIGISHKYPLLQSIINKIYEVIPQKELKKLQTTKKKIKFSVEEKKWLNQKIPIKYVYDPDWAPFEWKNGLEQHVGIVKDLLNTIEEKSGMVFIEEASYSWNAAIQKAKDRDADMYSAVGITDERKTYMNFTKESLFSAPYVFVTRKGEDYFNGFDKIQGKIISVNTNSTIQGIIEKDRPNLKLRLLKIEDEDGFIMLEKEKIDIYVVNAVKAEYYLKALGFNEKLKIAYKTAYNLDLKIAIRNDMPKEVISILDKSISEITKEEVSTIFHKWTQTTVEAKTDWILISKIVGVIGFITLLIILNNLKLNSLVKQKTAGLVKQKNEIEDLTVNLEKKVKEQTLDLENLLTSFNKNVIFSKTDLKGHITHASEEFCKISGYEKHELIGKTHAVVQHPDTVQKTFKDLWDSLNEYKHWSGEIKNRKKDGSSYWAYNKIEAEYDADGKQFGYSAISEDITLKKEIEELHKHTQESIDYAALIQRALIPDDSKFEKYFKDYLAIWRPKDTVGGDIYLFEELRSDNECLLMVIDCTGHGVSGAFVTMLVKAIERQVVSGIKHSDEIVSPAKILSTFNTIMKKLLKQEDKSSVSNAGLDGQVLYYNAKDKIVKFSSARNEIFYYQNDELKTTKGDRHSVGYKDSDINYEFSEYTIDVAKETIFYLSTDGYWDQLGGERSLSFGKRRLKKLLSTLYKKPMDKQKEELLKTLHEYKKGYEQNDDITMVAIKI